MRRRILAVAVAVVVVGGALLWWDKPWVPGIPLAAPGKTGRRVDEPGVFGNYFPAASTAPGVLLLGGSEGGLGDDVAKTAVALQGAGFSVLQLAYFGGPHQPSHLERVPLETFDRGLRWLQRRPEVQPDRLVVVGHSKGAEAALLVATRHPELRAVVAAAPSSVAWTGIDWNFPLNPAASWTAGGKPIASLPYALWRPWKKLDYIYKRGLGHLAKHRSAAIAVERISAPVLLLCGDRDTLWPSCPMARTLKTRARGHGKADVTVLEYQQAGHLLFGPRVGATDPALHDRWSGGTAAANNAARARGWPMVVSFLRRSLVA